MNVDHQDPLPATVQVFTYNNLNIVQQKLLFCHTDFKNARKFSKVEIRTPLASVPIGPYLLR